MELLYIVPNCPGFFTLSPLIVNSVLEECSLLLFISSDSQNTCGKLRQAKNSCTSCLILLTSLTTHQPVNESPYM